MKFEVSNRFMVEKYGNVRVSKIRSAYNDLRAAIRSGDLDAAEAALERYEQWAEFVFDERHKERGHR